MGIFQPHYTLADILVLSFLACSITSCALVCIHYLVKKSGLSETPDRLLFCLACSDLVGALMWFLDINFPGILCPYSGVINMLGYQSAQLWTCIIGAYLIITCSAKQPPPEIVFYVIAWGTPVLIQVVILNLHLYSVHPSPHGCWVKYGNIQIAFVTVPQMTSGLLNIVFLGTIVYKMRISAKRWGLQSRDRGLFFVMICFLLTTVSGLLESVPTRGNGDSAVYTVAVCFGGLQGFFNSIAMKQKAILLFLGSVKTTLRPPNQKRTLPNYSSFASSSSSPFANASTSLLSDEERAAAASSSSSFSSPHNVSPTLAKHPAITDSYPDYYQQLRSPTRPSSSAPAAVDRHPSLGQASMQTLSVSPYPINTDPPPNVSPIHPRR